jgi:hypothetical protein
VLATRVYPATVELGRDDDELARLTNEAVVEAGFRRSALAVADRFGDRLLQFYPSDWLRARRSSRSR